MNRRLVGTLAALLAGIAAASALPARAQDEAVSPTGTNTVQVGGFPTWRLTYGDWIATATVESLAAALDTDDPDFSPDERLARFLHQAARWNQNPAVVKFLLDRGADPNSSTSAGITPLRLAAANNGNPEVTRLLLDHGADPAATDRLGDSILHHAAGSSQSAAIIEALLDRGADPNARGNYGDTVLHEAAIFNRNPDLMRILLDRGADVDARDQFGNSALHEAARSNENPAVATLLLDRSADPNARNDRGETALHRAARWNENPAVVALLLDRGADISAQTNIGKTPLHLAAQSNETLAVSTLLLDRGAEVNARSDDGETPLHDTAQWNLNPAVAELLLDRGADAAAPDDYGQPPLASAIRAFDRPGAARIAELLAQRTGDDRVDAAFWERSANVWLAGETLPRVERWLGLSAGIGESIPDAFVLSAAENPDPAVLRLLLDRGGDPNATDDLGQTPLLRAVRRNPASLRATVELLLNRGASLATADADGQTPLHWAARQQDEHIAELLLDGGADASATDDFGRTPLHWAARLNREPTVAELLLARGADPAVRDHGGATALELAGLNPRWTVTESLLSRGPQASAVEVRLLDAAWMSMASAAQIDAQVASVSYRELLERDACGRAAFHLAVHYAARDISYHDFRESPHYQWFESLLQRWTFGDINVRDGTGNTPLHYAVAGAAKVKPTSPYPFRAPGVRVLSRLLSLGADREALGGGSLLPVHYAPYPLGSGDFALGGGPLAEYVDRPEAASISDPLTGWPFPDARVPADRYDPCIVSLP